MNSLSLSSILLGFAVGLALSFGVARLHYEMRLAPMRKRCEQLSGAHAQTSEMLLQARRQAESLQKELELARHQRRMPEIAAVRLTEPRPSNAGFMINSAFADTLMQAPPPSLVGRAA